MSSCRVCIGTILRLPRCPFFDDDAVYDLVRVIMLCPSRRRIPAAPSTFRFAII